MRSNKIIFVSKFVLYRIIGPLLSVWPVNLTALQHVSRPPRPRTRRQRPERLIAASATRFGDFETSW